MESAVSFGTTRIIWESACFDPVSVRLSAQRHGVRTDASTRYEKSLDPVLAGTVFSRVKEYMDFMNKKYTLVSQSSFVNESKLKHPVISLAYAGIDAKIGIHIDPTIVKNILTKLEFEICSETSEGLTVRVPSWRATKDISLPEDLYEEVVRIYGYEKIPLLSLKSEFTVAKRNITKDLEYRILDFLSARNWMEVYNYSFSNEVLDTSLGYGDMSGAIGVKNAFNREHTHMRRSLAGRLLQNIASNTKHSPDLSFFEIGNIYTAETFGENPWKHPVF